jgi:hypothetical protein
MSVRDLHLSNRERAMRTPLRLTLLVLLAACGDQVLAPTPTEPTFLKSALPLTATPSALDFAFPAAASKTVRVTAQYTTTVTATNAACATASPLSVPTSKPPGSSVYVATFTISPAAVGICTIRLTDKKGVRVSVSINVGAAGAMFFAAHEDDDLLFLNPDIAHAFAAGKYITTVYFTAGSCTGDTGENAYYLDREAGVRAAYAVLAGVANEWTVIDQPIREVRLTAEPRISLIFFRLPASKSEAGNVCDLAATNLRGLFNDGATDPDLALESLDEAHSYTRSQLVAAVTGLIRRWHPVQIETLDNRGLFATGADPTGRLITFVNTGGNCYYYDHSDHYYSAKFAWLADEAYADQHTIARHRGYNMANEPANLPAADLPLKRAMFSAYGQHDGAVGPGPFNAGYENWLERQYDSDLSPTPVQPLCGILAFAQAPPTSATAGVALDPQPVIQLQDADGVDQAIGDVEVTALAFQAGAAAITLGSVNTDASGRAIFSGLAIADAGQYDLDFVATGYAEHVVPIDVGAAP